MRRLRQVPPRLFSSASLRGGTKDHQNLGSLGHFSLVIDGRIDCVVVVGTERCGKMSFLSPPLACYIHPLRHLDRAPGLGAGKGLVDNVI